MSKEQLVEAIREHNPSARTEFLLHFRHDDLNRYLRRLTTLRDHRGRSTIWQRPEGAPAFCESTRRRPAA